MDTTADVESTPLAVKRKSRVVTSDDEEEMPDNVTATPAARVSVGPKTPSTADSASSKSKWSTPTVKSSAVRRRKIEDEADDDV